MTNYSQPWTQTTDSDRTDIVKNVETCSSSQLVDINPKSLNAAVSRSERSLETTEKSSVSDVFVPFLFDSVVRGTPSLMMLPSDGSAPKILVTVNSCENSMTLDSSAEISVAPIEMISSFVPPIKIPSSVKEVKTFGNSSVNLFGPVILQLQICGMHLRHPFYFIDAHTLFIGGYDLMRAARLVVAVDNRIVWSRCPDSLNSDSVSPNPPVSVNNETVYSGVMFVQPRIAQRTVSPCRTVSSGGESLDIKHSGHAFPTFPFPFQRVTAPSSVASSLANLDNKISPESSPIFFTPPTSPLFFTPPTSPVDFVQQSPAIPTFNSYVDTENGTHSVTVDVEFSATPVCSSGSASRRKRGLGFKIEQTCSAFKPIASRPVPTISSSPASCTAQTSTTSGSPSSIVSRQVSAVVNRPTVGRNVISTSALNLSAPVFRPRTKLRFDTHHPRVISSSSQLSSKEDPNHTACKVADTRCDAFFGEANGFHSPRPPDSSMDDNAEVYHPSRPPEFYSDTEETLLKKHSIFQPSTSSYCLPLCIQLKR